jgi:hypothetical protein
MHDIYDIYVTMVYKNQFLFKTNKLSKIVFVFKDKALNTQISLWNAWCFDDDCES